MKRQDWLLLGLAVLVGGMIYGVARYVVVDAPEPASTGPAIVAMVALLIVLLPRVVGRMSGGEALTSIALWVGLGAALVVAYQWREPVAAALRGLVGSG